MVRTHSFQTFWYFCSVLTFIEKTWPSGGSDHLSISDNVLLHITCNYTPGADR